MAVLGANIQGIIPTKNAMNTFYPGDIVVFKRGVSPEMMVIDEADGIATVYWQDAAGESSIEDCPVTALKEISAHSCHLPVALRKVAELLKGS